MVLRQLLYLSLLVNAGVCTALSPPKTIYISTGQWPPYMDQGRRDQGCVAKLIRDAFALSNLKVRFVFMPWDRAYQEGQKKAFSGSAYWYFSEQRAQDYIYTKTPVTTEVSRFYHLTSLNLNYQTYKDLAPYRLVLNQGLTYPDELLEAIERHDISIVNATYTTKNLSFLLRERADVVILTEQTKTEYAKTLTQEQNKLITFQDKPAFVTQGYLLINKHSAQYVSIFDVGVKTLWQDRAYFDNYIKSCLRLKSDVNITPQGE
ncbi:ABC transporter substrate-binding protein [Pseudoalteromonas sp. A25]|uniref:substrate-binding periplasmic protein n=1 Tax=Pseudoalteromonas sp. A25 TaxID=116092 RepID=UPI001260FC3C|nr:transporter substrate-binding domain-containing protein [Pseudoalteromonas sp. A25]BBN80109.1 ABC transporter substrate-binding protein [Pseudoalteromonas sp. A25]